MNNKKVWIPIISFIVGITLIICAFVIVAGNPKLITDNTSKMVAQAEKFYIKGDTDSAFYQLEIYCDEKPDNTDGFIDLDYY